MNVSHDVLQRWRQDMTKVDSIADAANRNEQLTRQRVTRLETLLSRTFWGRMKWLFLGR